MLKKRKVIELQSKEIKTSAILGTAHFRRVNDGHFDSRSVNGYHLYIVSDEEIKEGDWYLYWLDNQYELMQCQDDKEADRCNNHSMINYLCSKIIATTDKMLTLDDGNDPKVWHLPWLSQGFIEKYISEYKKGNQIEDVMVEYEEGIINPRTEPFPDNLDYADEYGAWNRLKTSYNNTITIKKVKDSWSREEVCAIIRDVHNVLNIESTYAKDYIKENL